MSTPASEQGSRFPRRSRLTRGRELQAVIHEGKRIRTERLDVRVLASPLDYPRVGIVVPRHQHTAVARNRLKRRLRELVRLHLLRVLGSEDLVIRARREAYDASYESLARDIDRIKHVAGASHTS